MVHASTITARQSSVVAPLCNRGIARHRAGRLDDALADFDEAVRLYPEFGTCYYNRGVTRTAAGDVHEAIALCPDVWKFRPARAVTYGRLGESDKAPADIDAALKTAPDGEAEPHFVRGMINELRGARDEALRDYSEAIRLDPAHARAWCSRGIMRLYGGDPGSAMSDFDEAIRLDDGIFVAWFMRGQAHAAAGNRDAAVADLQAAFPLARRRPPAMPCDGHSADSARRRRRTDRCRSIDRLGSANGRRHGFAPEPAESPA
jgi:tetratricopeptide (TPR) repeat protein